MASNNKNAANILTELMDKGSLVQQPDGSFNVASGANEIGNMHEQYDWVLETSLSWDVNLLHLSATALSLVLD